MVLRGGRPATAACNAIIHNYSVDYSAEMNFANEPCLGVPNHKRVSEAMVGALAAGRLDVKVK